MPSNVEITLAELKNCDYWTSGEGIVHFIREIVGKTVGKYCLTDAEFNVVVSECLCRAQKYALNERCTSTGQFVSGLAQVARSKATQELRDRADLACWNIEFATAQTALEDVLGDPVQQWRSKTELEVRRALVQEMLDRLPAADRSILVAIYIDERDIAEVAGVLGLSRNALDQKLFRIKARARAAYRNQWERGV